MLHFNYSLYGTYMSAEMPPFEMPGNTPDPEDDTHVPALEISGGVNSNDRGGRLTSGDGEQEFGSLEEANQPATAEPTDGDHSNDKPEPDEAETLTQQQQTLTIGAWASVCGNCGDNAFPYTETHVIEDGPSCGVRWKFVSVDGIPTEAAEALRPDLTYVEPDRSKDGLTADMEAANFSVFEALHDQEDPDL